MSAHPYEVVVRPHTRETGRFAYLIRRSDNPNWAEGSMDSFSTPEEARRAGYERVQRLLSSTAR